MNMKIRHTQLSYDESLWERKNALAIELGKEKVTFAKILIAGIESLEVESKKKNQPQKERTRVDYGEPDVESPLEKKTITNQPNPIKPGGFLFYLDLPKGVLSRSFDVFDGSMWSEVPLDLIPNNTMFRIREDGYVIAFQGNKHFYKDTQPLTIDGIKKLLIYPVKYKD